MSTVSVENADKAGDGTSQPGTPRVSKGGSGLLADTPVGNASESKIAIPADNAKHSDKINDTSSPSRPSPVQGQSSSGQFKKESSVGAVKVDDNSKAEKLAAGKAKTAQRKGHGKRIRESAIKTTTMTVDEDEHLGDDFLNFKWTPPSMVKAEKYKTSQSFRMGTADLYETDVTNAADLSIGANLYFVFLKYIACFFLISALLSIPAIVFSFYGNGVKKEDQDALGLYRFSIGNIGYNPESSTYLEDAKCHLQEKDYTGTCLHIGGSEIKTSDASYIMSVCEILVAIAFYITVTKMNSKCNSIEEETAGLVSKVSDYTIQVKGIPLDTKPEELVMFFSGLYQLDQRDFRNRPPIENVKPVHDLSFNIDPIYMNKYVAECVVHKRIGRYIKAFKAQQEMLGDLYHHRAEMKMYNEGTLFAKGNDPKRFEKAGENVKKCEVKFNDLIRSVSISASNNKPIARNQIAPAPSNASEGSPRPAEGTKNTPTSSPLKASKSSMSNIDADAIVGYVVFQYTESFARAIEDYERYSHFPYNFFYPKAMLFRDKYKLKISKAYEPDEMVWENLEVDFTEKYLHRAFTAFASLVLLIICFVVILQSTIYKEKFNSKIPDTSLCVETIPSLYNKINFHYPNNNFEDLNLMRPANNSAISKGYDKRCDDKVSGSFYGIYTDYPRYDINISKYYSFAACDNGICPEYNADSQCPCISVNSKEKCQSKACTTSSINSASCMEFEAGVIGACYCMDKLLSVLNSKSITDAMNQLQSTDDPNCKQFFINYAKATSISYVAILVTIIINSYLPQVLEYLTHMEKHTSIDHEKGSLMYKVFFPTFFNMAILVLIASGKIGGQSDAIKPLHFFQGTYEDFDTRWYGNIGAYFITTYIIQAIGPLLIKSFDYWISAPLTLWWHYKAVIAKTSRSIVRQSELDNLVIGQPFDYFGNQALLLALLFFGMTYSPGLPIIALMSCITFVVYYWLEKLMLLRYNMRPRKSGNGIMIKVVFLCQIALLMRLAIGCWMYGNPYILAPGFIKTNMHPEVPEYVPSMQYEKIMYEYIDYAKIGLKYAAIFADRLLRPNVFFLLLFLCIFIAIIIIKYVLKNFPLLILLKALYKRICKSNEVAVENEGGTIYQIDIQKTAHPLRNEVAPYTGTYYKYVLDPPIRSWDFFKSEDSGRIELTDEDVQEGWRVEYKTPYKFKMKLKNSGMGGKSEFKKTYEVCADHGCNSYQIEKIPEYQLALKGIKEAVDKFMNDKSLVGEVAVNSPV